MINKTCPLSNKEKLYVTLHHECNHWLDNWKEPNENCKECPYIKSLLNIPLIRGVFPKLIAEEIFGVQPMAGPIGSVPKLKFVYKGKKNVRKKLSTK